VIHENSNERIGVDVFVEFLNLGIPSLLAFIWLSMGYLWTYGSNIILNVTSVQ
jgi:hypothetical protein